MNNHEINEGDKVTYSDINLRQYQGTIVSVGKTSRGGDCLVQWNKYPLLKSEESASNLIKSLPHSVVDIAWIDDNNGAGMQKLSDTEGH